MRYEAISGKLVTEIAGLREGSKAIELFCVGGWRFKLSSPGSIATIVGSEKNIVCGKPVTVADGDDTSVMLGAPRGALMVTWSEPVSFEITGVPDL